ncbi:hypothetical protein GCM10007079_29850 [Nocardiopsis terrae]|uniref:Uncharacterized protein n=1 Tax=Nocardiopsis terrae TaxID=372655 RepID=A0ABR9HIM4_9ACTN|nr:hypothetical protein [Nocardiopsis terrae]MBE1458816.1 hypothetical protein [Nocardiopsis terrae]GHC86492.1 hypothetical protein GCM10007079_29850 [Nocardiopsis terrae]
MIALAVLFGVFCAGACTVGALALRARREACALSEEVTRAAGGYQASSADLRERISRGGADT